MSVKESDDVSQVRLEVLMMRSFGTGDARAKVEQSPFNQLLLPLPFAFGANPPPTPLAIPLHTGSIFTLTESLCVARLCMLPPQRRQIRTLLPLLSLQSFYSETREITVQAPPTSIVKILSLSSVRITSKRAEEEAISRQQPRSRACTSVLCMRKSLNCWRPSTSF